MKGAPAFHRLLEVPVTWVLEYRSRCSDPAPGMRRLSPACQIRPLVPIEGRAYQGGGRGLLIWGMGSVFHACQIGALIQTKMKVYLPGEKGRLIVENGSVFRTS